MSVKRELLKLLPDKIYLQLQYYKYFKKFINFKHPKTFNEKLQWLKLNDKKPQYTELVDKYQFKKVISQKLGEEFVVPLINVYDQADEIDFDQLPNQFVLKATHDSGSVFICKDKTAVDIPKVRQFFNQSLKINYFYGTREWPYKQVKPRIIAEQYLIDESGFELKDYKVFCFNGVPKLIGLVKGRTNTPTEDFYSTEWKKVDIEFGGYPNSTTIMEKPVFLEEMLRLSTLLAKDTYFLRVDWNYANQHLKLGELTFYETAGLETIKPDHWNQQLGEWIQLPIDRTYEK